MTLEFLRSVSMRQERNRELVCFPGGFTQHNCRSKVYPLNFRCCYWDSLLTPRSGIRHHRGGPVRLGVVDTNPHLRSLGGFARTITSRYRALLAHLGEKPEETPPARHPRDGQRRARRDYCSSMWSLCSPVTVELGQLDDVQLAAHDGAALHEAGQLFGREEFWRRGEAFIATARNDWLRTHQFRGPDGEWQGMFLPNGRPAARGLWACCWPSADWPSRPCTLTLTLVNRFRDSLTATQQDLYRHVTAFIRKSRCSLSRDCLVSV